MPATLATKAGKPTFKEAKFAEHYVRLNGNGTQAALASYDTTNENMASVIASENIRKSRVEAEIARIVAEVNIDKVQAKEIGSKLASIAFNSKEKAENQLKALDSLGKWRGMFQDRTPSTQINVLNQSITLSGLSKDELQGELLSILKASAGGAIPWIASTRLRFSPPPKSLLFLVMLIRTLRMPLGIIPNLHFAQRFSAE